eukprot:COSAG02_NODE_69_length_42323_cov_23.507850_5_plen_152_part_00
MVVHCNMGMSRSAAIVIGYLISGLGWTYERAYRHTKLRRAVVRPNDGFESILQHLEVNSSNAQDEWQRGETVSDSRLGGRPHEYSSTPGAQSSADDRAMDGEVGAAELSETHTPEQRACRLPCTISVLCVRPYVLALVAAGALPLMMSVCS